MNKREESKVDMYKDVSDVIDTPEEGLQLPPGIIAVNNDLKTVRSNILAKESRLKGSTIGKTEAKDICLEELIEDAVIVCGAIYAHAVKINDVELERFADVSERSLKNSREAEVPIRVKDIFIKAAEIGSALAEFGTAQTELDEYRTDLANFNEKAGKQNSGFTDKSAARDDLDSLFANADKDVEIIARLMKKYERTNPEYYNRFAAARCIKNKATRKKTTEDKPAEQPQNP